MSSLPPVEAVDRVDIIDSSQYDPQAPEQNTPNPFARDILFAATNLDSWEADDIRYGQEVMLDICYRQLDAPYYAWLRDKMTQVKHAHDSGKMKSDLFQELRQRFNTIHDWALRHIGEEALSQAVQTTSIKSYVPPSQQTFTAYRKTQDEAWEAFQQNGARGNSSQSDQSRKLEYLLATQGYAGIRSSFIEELVVIVRDDTVTVPAKWTNKVRFTMNELALMIGSSPEAVKQIYEVKRVFGGEVVPAADDPFKEDESRAKRVAASTAQQNLFQAGTAATA